MFEYIEKQAVTTIPILPKEYRKYQTMNLDDAYENGWYDALKCVEKLPLADVRPMVRGVWKKMPDNTCVCSICGLGLETWTQAIFYNFCPRCGADMNL